MSEQDLRSPIQRLLRLPHGDVIGAALVISALLVVFFWRAIFLGESLLPNDLIYELDPVWRNHAPAGFTAPGNRLLSDTVYFHFPWQAEIQRSLAERRIPLWSPYINTGQPLLGNGQVNVWDPFWLIARLFPFHSSFLIAAILKLWVGGLFTFLLARRLGIGRRGAILTMLVFAFSGPMIVWLGYTVSGVAAWLPLLLYLSERALTRQAAAPFLAASSRLMAVGIVIAFQFLSAHPETSLHVVLTWAVFCLARVVARDGWHVPRLIRLGSRMALALAIGLSLAAAQLLPTAEGILNSSILISRQAGAPAAPIQMLLFDWHNWPTLVTTILPQYFGTPIDNSYWYPFQNYNEQTVYVGVVPLALGLVTLLAWWHERRNNRIADTPSTGISRGLKSPDGGLKPALRSPRPEGAGSGVEGSPDGGFWIGLTLLALGIAAHLPLINAANVLPVLRLANHGRLRLVYALGMALLAGYGLDALARNHIPRFDAPKRFLLVLGGLASVSLILIGGAYAGVTALREQFIAMGRSQAEAMKAIDHPMFPYSLEYYYERVNIRYTQTQRLYTPETPEMFLPVGAALLAGLLEWRRRRGHNQALWLNGLVLLACADLFVIGIRVNPTIPPAHNFPTTEAVEFVRQQPGIFRVSGLYLALMPNTSMVFGLSDARGHEPVVPWRRASLASHVEGAFQLNHYALLRSADSRLLDLMNVEYIITDRELGGRWELVFTEQDSPIRVYRNSTVMPRAFIVYQTEHAAHAEAALNRLLDEDFDFRTRVILEGTPSELLAVSGASSQAGPARIVTYEPERVVIETDTPADGILVLTDTYVPGWQARVDGQPTEVYVADYTFRGVRIPTGQHRVELVYTPVSFTIGAIISLAAIVCCAAWIAVRRLEAVAIIYRKRT